MFDMEILFVEKKVGRNKQSAGLYYITLYYSL